ncbi:MAG: 4-hydroxyphenylpyruvate dioxygenase [Bacteriovoracaceae bacterium]
MVTNDNPIGLIHIDHLEFTCDTLESQTKDLFYRLGFSKNYENKTTHSELYSQGQIRFILTANSDQHSQSRKYFNAHGEGVNKISFQVENAEAAINEAVKRGAKAVQDLTVKETKYGIFKTAAIQGFGDVVNEFVERPKGNDFLRPGYMNFDQDIKAKPLETRVSRIDHLTNNVPKGQLEHWVEFYQRVYGFKVTRYFDIKGLKSGLESKVVQSPSGNIIIPINEPEKENGKSQIQEFLDLHKGPGVQHIALTTPNIISTLGDLQKRGMEFLKIPHTYYTEIQNRKIFVTEDLDILEKHQILVDGEGEEYLLQIFSKCYVGPLFFEFIQRKKHLGFGEGNFQALFDAIERDQVLRGYLN